VKNFHKESSGNSPEPRSAANCVATGDAPNPGPVPGGIRPLRLRSAGTRPGRIPHHPPAMPGGWSPMYTVGSGAQDGVNSGTAVRGAPRGERSSDGVEPGHNSRPGFGRRVCMLLSFQRPSHLFQEGNPPQGRARVLGPVPGRTDEYSAQNRRRRGGDGIRGGGISCGRSG
jgi:hypothetical protein